jgi:hypothetical protein
MKKWRKIAFITLSALVLVQFGVFMNLYYNNHGSFDGFWNIFIGG